MHALRDTNSRIVRYLLSYCMITGGLSLLSRAMKSSITAQGEQVFIKVSRTLDSLTFDNLAIRSLPIDPEERNYVRPAVPNACFSRVFPEPVVNPKIVAASQAALDLLDLSVEELKRPDSADYLSGNKLFPGAMPHSHCYCGYQFGSFSGQLGDGAAMYLGEVINSKGERWEIQFKGAGPTPYSRRGDGRKVLRSTIREFLCSEAIHFLGIPTTRAATMVTSDTLVMRDLFYTGDVINERASIVLRLAPTFLRFGSFEIFKSTDPQTGRAGPSENNIPLLKTMLQYSIDTFFPEASAVARGPGGLSAGTLLMFKEVVRRTAELVALWQCVGFTHGVLNTDNMSLVGLTVDYGPYGFMEHFDRDYVPNGSDGTGRYRYQDQPEICKWNLGKFLEALQPVLPEEEAEAILEQYDEIYKDAYNRRMRSKLGIISPKETDEMLIEQLFDTMAATSADFTSTFRILIDFAKGAHDEASIDSTADALVDVCASPEVLSKSINRALKIGRPGIPADRLLSLWSLVQANPEAVASKFGTSADALVSELEGELRKMEASEAARERSERLKDMTIEMKGAEDKKRWVKWLALYSNRLGIDSADLASMYASNPSYILRNWKVQETIAAAESGDFGLVQNELERLSQPYTTADSGSASENTINKLKPPKWAAELICTCSS